MYDKRFFASFLVTFACFALACSAFTPQIVVVLCNCDHGTNVDIAVRDLTTRLGTQVAAL